MNNGNNENGSFWGQLLIACIPALILTMVGSYVAVKSAIADTKISLTELTVQMALNKELYLEKFSSIEKSRTEQYQYLIDQTKEIKDELKLKKNINQIISFKFDSTWSEGMIIETRGSKIIKFDSSDYYKHIADSLYIVLSNNYSSINDAISLEKNSLVENKSF